MIKAGSFIALLLVARRRETPETRAEPAEREALTAPIRSATLMRSQSGWSRNSASTIL